MKKIILTFFYCLALLLLGTTLTAQNNCNSKEIKQAAIDELSPYYYSSAKITHLDPNDFSSEEIEIQLLKGEKYKIVFNTAELSEALVVEVYDKPNNNEKRNLIFSNKDKAKKIFAFEPEKSKNLYLNYSNATHGTETNAGCAVFVLGYLLDF